MYATEVRRVFDGCELLLIYLLCLRLVHFIGIVGGNLVLQQLTSVSVSYWELIWNYRIKF